MADVKKEVELKKKPLNESKDEKQQDGEKA